MKKNVLAIILIVILLLAMQAPVMAQSSGAEVLQQGDSGQEVIQLQQRLKELGYLNYRATGKFSEMTAAAVRKFQTENGISPDGQVGADTMQKILSDDAVRCPINPAVTKVFGPADSGTVTQRGALSSWETISTLFPVGGSAVVTDLNTGHTFTMLRTGGVNCAHVTTQSAADYTAYTESFGGGQSWEHRSVLVDIGGVLYAASLFGMPTGGASTDGLMSGYTVLYFNNGKTDVLSLIDDEHAIALTLASSQ